MSEPTSQLIDITDSPYCQIANKRISPSQCRDMQGQEGCFGCAAPTRLCEYCKEESATVTAIGLGGHCLASQLREEKKTREPIFPPGTQVSCQMAHKSIGVAMCLATQGQEGCRGCQAPSRLCEKCKKRPSRFRQYGLCLSCSVKEFEEDSESADDESEKPVEEPACKEVPQATVSIPHNELVTKNLLKARKIVIIAEKASAFFLARHLDIPYPIAQTIIQCLEEEGIVGPARGTKAREVLVRGKDLILPVKRKIPELVKANKLCIECGERPVWVKKWGLCSRCGQAFYKREGKRGATTIRKNKARKVVRKQTFVVTKKKRAPRAKTITLKNKVRRLKELAETFGTIGETARILKSVISDLQQFENLRSVLLKTRRPFLK